MLSKADKSGLHQSSQYDRRVVNDDWIVLAAVLYPGTAVSLIARVYSDVESSE